MEETARILAVDDSITIRKALEIILAPAGYTVELAASGAEALAKARDFAPSVILLDFILPDMRGIDVCNALVADPATRGIPVVLISARGAEIRQAYLAADNVVEYLVKPFTPDEVLSVIQAVLSSDAEAEEAGGPSAEVPAEYDEGTVESEGFDGAEEEIEAPAAEEAETAEAGLEAEASEWEEEEAPARPALRDEAGQRDRFDAMFETLRAGLEGVYVEESEAVGGDPARTYTDLAAALAQQLGETFAHATSGRRFALASDGSVRSLEDALLDAHRRVCRLLFRAVGAGVVAGESAVASQPRVLVLSGGRGVPAPGFTALSELPGCTVFHITADFGQLPLMSRCFGPSHIVVDLAAKSALDELAKLRDLGELRRVRLLGVTPRGAGGAPAAHETTGISTLISSGPSLAEDIRACILRGSKTETAVATVGGEEAHGAASLAGSD